MASEDTHLTRLCWYIDLDPIEKCNFSKDVGEQEQVDSGGGYIHVCRLVYGLYRHLASATSTENLEEKNGEIATLSWNIVLGEEGRG